MMQNEAAQKINAAFDESGVTFHDRAAAIAEFRQGRDIVFDDDGAPQVEYDGEQLPLATALTRFAFDRRDLIDGRSLPREGTPARAGTMSKADFQNVKEKSEFISKFGLDAYSKLPARAPQTGELTHREQWYSLSTAEKVRRIKADPQAFAKLPPAPREPQPVGGYINHEGLRKAAAVRPGGR